MTYFTQETLRQYLDQKLISESCHPDAPHVRIYNYTPLCQYQQVWDDVTMQCRGLILDTKKECVLARPFKKFFNYQEHINKGMSVPREYPVITTKYDGSLGILYWLRDRPCIATRGSFTSDQAIWANEWLRNNIPYNYLHRNMTYLFEIIYNANKIVVDYPFEGLVLLALLDTEGQGEVSIESERNLCPYIASKVDLADLETIAGMDEPNSEGFVIHYPDAALRLKIKFPSYVRLHKIITGFSEKGIWEHLRDGGSLEEILVNAPDEMYPWIKETSKRLQGKFDGIEFMGRWVAMQAKDFPTRKDQAAYITKTDYAKIAFQMLDGKDYRDTIWRMIEPRGPVTFRRDMGDV